MKDSLLLCRRKLLVSVCLIVFSIVAQSQQTLTTIAGCNAYVYLPPTYSSSTAKYPVIVFFPGIGEVGTDASKLLIYGPSHFISTGVKLEFDVNGVHETPIFISVQPTAQWPNSTFTENVVKEISSKYRVDPDRFHLTGLSMGAWMVDQFLSDAKSARQAMIASVAVMHAPTTNNNIANFGVFATAGGRWWGVEGGLDLRKMDLVAAQMNATKPGSAKYTLIPAGASGSTHCCWNNFYDPNWRVGGQNLYEYMLSTKRSSGPPPPPANILPTVNAGSNVIITLPTNSVTLTGTASDADGSISSTSWTKVSGPAATIVSPGSLTTNITGLQAGSYVFQLSATDNSGGVSTASVTVTVNSVLPPPPPPGNVVPTVNAGGNVTITLPTNSVTLTGTASDADGSISSTSWTKVSGPAATIVSPGSLTTNITGLQAGSYVFQLSATDNSGAVSTSSVTVTVNAAPANIVPTVNAGSNVIITLPTNSVTLTGTASDADGSISSTSWTKFSGPAATIVSPGSLTTNITGLQAGSYVFQLSATDNSGAISTSSITVTVNSALPPPPPPGGCGCDIELATRADGGIYANGASLNVKPGNTVCIKAGTYKYINLSDFNGTASSRINIVNCGGQVIVAGGPSYGISITQSTYFKLSGTGASAVKYGIKVDGAAGGNYYSSGMGISTGSTEFEIENMEIAKSDVGIICKTTTTCDPITWKGGADMRNISFHDMYVHDISGEGFYIGHTSRTVPLTCNGNAINAKPLRIYGLKVYNNIVENLGWDGIQVASAPENCEVYNNVVRNFGTKNQSSQQAGILFGGGCSGKVYGNYVENGTGNGMQVFGVGNIDIFNNVIYDVGGNYVTSLSRDGIMIDDRPVDDLPSTVVTVANNTVIKANRCGIRLENTNLTFTQTNKFYNNLVVNPGETNLSIAYLAVRNGAPADIQGNINVAAITDAKFVNAAAHDFHITLPSPAVDKGISVSGLGIVVDKDGNPRSLGSATDAGAYELTQTGGNQAPIANAGSNQTITLPTNTVTLNGSGTDADGSIVSYDWSKLSGPAASIISPIAAQTVINSLVEGVYIFRLVVTDDKGATGTATVTITVKASVNQAPTANAGSNQTITLPINTVTLNGSGTDADGTIASYSWTKVSGPAATIVSSSSAQTVINNLVEGIYAFSLTVTDNKGATATATVTVTVKASVNQAPIANAGSTQTITLPINTVTLNGSGTDTDGSIAGYSWTKISGPTAVIVNPTAAQTAINNLVEGVYIFSLAVTDDKGATGTSTVTITVNAAPAPPVNQAPLANAGSTQTITLPVNTVTLNGSGTDADGTIASYSWTKVSGPVATIVSASSAQTVINGLVEGTYTFRLTVTDNDGAIGEATVTVIVKAAANQAPIADAGTDQTITLPINTVTLNGSGTDADGTITSYSWTKVSGPTATIASSSSAQTAINGLVEGIYTFRLTVTDNKGATGSAIVKVTVLRAPNQAPTAYAGSNQTIILPVNTVTLNGNGSDADGSISSYSWIKVSGPTATIASPSSAQTSINNLLEGVYTFRLTVTDDDGATGTSTVIVTVNAAAAPPVNQAPTANAGSNQTITLPINTVTLNGSGTDADGTIASYSWTKVSGPAATIVSSSSAQTVINGLVEGTYTFRLTVTDNGGAIGTAVVTVTVKLLPNQAPIANAGSTQTITLPINTVTLNGSGTDTDGSIAGYSWTKISGPTAVIVNPTAAQTAINNLVEGVYIFSLAVTDDKGATGTSTVTITVNAAPAPPVNQAPLANAGSTQTITLPVNTVTLNGSGTDADGTIASYSWTKVSGPVATIVSASSAQTVINGLVEGTYTFRLTVTDNDGAIGEATVTVIVKAAANQAPIADAGTDQTITLPINTVTLNGSGTDADGTITSYSWTKVSGPTATIASSSSAQTAINGLVEGIYTFRLTVTDNKGATSSDMVIVTVDAAIVSVPNQTPISNAGADQTITLPVNKVTLDGSGADMDGTIVSYSWTMVSGPGAIILNSGSPQTNVNDLVEGVYTFRLTVTDDGGATSNSIVTITVLPAIVLPNQAPIANAGADKVITLPTSNIVLDGTASYDPDGSIVSYSWVKISGPNPSSLNNSNMATATIPTVLPGVYVYELAVTDDRGAVSSDLVTITVNGAAITANQKPVANAGADVTLELSSPNLTLDGKASYDPDGTISTYNWKFVSGPSGAIIQTPNAVGSSVSKLVEGEYYFELTVTDNKGDNGKDTVKVTVVNNLKVTTSIILYPNPAVDKMKVRYTSDKIGKMKLRVFDATGKYVQSYDIDKQTLIYEQEINVSNLIPGSYFLRIDFGNEKVIVQKFIKMQ